MECSNLVMNRVCLGGELYTLVLNRLAVCNIGVLCSLPLCRACNTAALCREEECYKEEELCIRQ